ncbi:MAG: hypothetical protein R3F42_04205 [Pseudomonadota bacterium]
MANHAENHTVLDALPAGPLTRLLTGTDWSLADWYAVPLAPALAARLLAATRDAFTARLLGGASPVTLRVLQQIVQFALDGTVGEAVTHTAGAREHALGELVRGQLLASRKLQPAMTHLERGFRLAAPFLATADYFRLLHEHELLACLPYGATPAVAQDLPALLNEAAVIRRLRQGDRRRPVFPHTDTLG